MSTRKTKSCWTPLLALLAAVFAVGLISLGTPTVYACDGQGTHCWDAGGDAVAATETGLGPDPIFNHQGEGTNFVKVGTTTRIWGMVTPQVNPFVLTVPALPAGAVPVETFISWNYLADDNPMTDVITVNGTPVTGSWQGSGSPDVCWGKDFGVNYLASGLTSLVNPGAAPVNVTIQNATDKALGADDDAYGEGLTILVVYKIPGEPIRNLDIYSGYISTQSGPVMGTAAATLNFTVAYTMPDFHFFVNALDGQVAPDDFYIDGILRSGQIAGTSPAGDAWVGLLGPNANRNFYDHANDDISSFFTPVRISIDISTIRPSDCIGHSFAAVSFPLESLSLSSSVDILPDPLYVYTSYQIDPPPGYAYVGDLSDGYDVTQIDLSSVMINASVVPTSATVIPGYPGFTGPVLELTFALRDFVEPYEPVWDEETREYTITGQITSGPPFTGNATLQMIGHLTGDADGNNVVNVADAVYLTAYIFTDGPEPYLWEAGDVDCNGVISVSDAVYLLRFIFAGGPEPCEH